MYSRAVIKVGGSLAVILPSEIVKYLKVKKGDELRFNISRGEVVLFR